MDINNLYDGTLQEAIHNFTGDYYEVPIEHKLLINETLFREMTVLEKRCYTLWMRKVDERDKVIASACGLSPKTVKMEHNRKRLEDVFEKFATDEDKVKFRLLWKQAEFFRGQLFLYIKSTFMCKVPGRELHIKIRPGWRIVYGESMHHSVSGSRNLSDSISIISPQ